MLTLLANLALAAPFTPADVCAMPVIGGAALAPDGSAVVYAVTTCDVAEDSSSSDLYYLSTRAGAEPVRLTTHEARDHGPHWSPDGHSLAFVSTRSGSSQVWIFDGFFGEPRQLTRHEGGASSPVWTPDSSQLLFLSRGPEPEEEATDVQVRTDLLYRKGRDGRTRHVYAVSAAGGDASRLTDGDRDWGEVVVSPDGSRFAAVREASHEGGLFDIDTDVWLVPMGGGEPTLLTDNPGPDHDPAWTPDGRVLTRSILEEGYESGKHRLMLWSPEGGAPVELTQGIDRSCFRMAPSADGRAALAVLDGPGTWHVGRIPLNRPGQVEWLTEGDAWVWGLAAEGGTLLLTAADGAHPTELWLSRERGKAAALDWETPVRARRLTDLAGPFLAEREVAIPEPLWVEVEGRRVQAFYSPPSIPVYGPPPLVVDIHGGPQWQEGHYWQGDRQVLAGAGYAVLTVSFTGSTGHGQAFVDAIAGDWGGAPLEDVMATLDEVIAQGLADPERVAITGGSYGGYLVAQAIAVHPERFAAAIPERGVYDQVSMYGTTDEQFFPEKDLLGTPWTHPEVYAASSPLRLADRIRTPTLVIHGEADTRVPVSQAHELFTALLRHGVDAELVVFTGAGHGFSRRGRPTHRVQRYEHVLRWLDSHLH